MSNHRPFNISQGSEPCSVVLYLSKIIKVYIIIYYIY